MPIQTAQTANSVPEGCTSFETWPLPHRAHLAPHPCHRFNWGSGSGGSNLQESAVHWGSWYSISVRQVKAASTHQEGGRLTAALSEFLPKCSCRGHITLAVSTLEILLSLRRQHWKYKVRPDHLRRPSTETALDSQVGSPKGRMLCPIR